MRGERWRPRWLAFWPVLPGRLRRRLTLGLLLTVAEAAAAGAPVVVLVIAIDEVADGRMDPGRALAYAVVLTGAVGLEYGLAAGANRLLWAACYQAGAELRHAVLHRLRALPMSHHWRAGQAGQASTVLTVDIAALETLLGWVLPTLLRAVALPAAVLIALLVLSPPIAFAVAITVAVTIPVHRWAQRRYRTLMARQRALQAEIGGRAVEYVQGAEVFRQFGADGTALHRFRTAVKQLRTNSDRILRDVGPPGTLVGTMIGLAIPVSLLAAAIVLALDQAAFTAVMAALILVARIYHPLTEVFARAEGLAPREASAARLRVLLDTPVPTIGNPAAKAASTGRAHPGVVELDGVSLRYPNGRLALDAVDLRLAPGSVTAVVGPSGAGKSTLVHLIAGLLTPSAGTVRIGGVDVSALDELTRAETVSAVLQDGWLFSGSIADNIVLARPRTTRAEVVAVARATGCHAFVSELPEGYDTRIGEQGAGLSGGQRQQLAVARALLKDAPVLLLDEMTAAVDLVTERALRAAVSAVAARRTVLLVAHRLSMVRHADQIVVLDAGRIVERGTHAELATAGGIYQQLWQRWQTSASWQLTRADRNEPAAR